MIKLVALIGVALLLHSCGQLKDDLSKIDTAKIEQIGEKAVEDVAEEVLKDETGIDLSGAKK